MSYQQKNPIRIVTAASLFDGHDAAINMIRRLLQDRGVEVIHLGHNRSVFEVVKAVLEESAQGVCISSYQGGHMEYFKYLLDLLRTVGAPYVKVFGGGGGVIIHSEKKELEDYGITKIFHPDDGRRLGLDGMMDVILKACDFSLLDLPLQEHVKPLQRLFEKPGLVPQVFASMPSHSLGLILNEIEARASEKEQLQKEFPQLIKKYQLESFAQRGWVLQAEQAATAAVGKGPVVLGMTGTGGAGKSSLIDELAGRFLNTFPDKKIAVLCVDPSKRKTGGALLGDRIRMNSLERARIFMRSLASRGSNAEVSQSLAPSLDFLRTLDFDLIIAETSGIGQGNMAITEVSDLSLYVMTSEFGAGSQLEKIEMIDFADFIAINKADRRGSEDALRDVTKAYKRSRKITSFEAEVPVFLTQAARFNDKGVNKLFKALCQRLSELRGNSFQLSDEFLAQLPEASEHILIPPDRQNYLAEIVKCVRSYKEKTQQLKKQASRLGALNLLENALAAPIVEEQKKVLFEQLQQELPTDLFNQLLNWDALIARYKAPLFSYEVRGKTFSQPLFSESLSGLKIPKIALPRLTDWGDRLEYLRLENVPGEFPFTQGVFPLKRTDEDPKRMFAGEGGPERTNKRFHFLCEGEPAKRLSTAFDSVTLYGEDPQQRPDIFGKVGESGVSISSLTDMKTLYKGFDLCSKNTSVSMTINGPAPMILAFFLNTAIDAELEKREAEKGSSLTVAEAQEVKARALKEVRGTVQADILKEDQGQNTCIFSIHFALKMMGDIQQYFIDHEVRNFYSVSISGYHIAEAGANPISQLAFTLSNGFTFVEYYLNRGMHIDDFAPNLSFFFSNGLDPEYSVLGRVARRIWAITLKEKYGASERSQKLKYHIQTSGRSLHAQEIDFNDIRTTLQALLALYDNCNSLHTNAFDEAITTPTEASVRRAMAIQLIINKEFGLTKNENPMQGSYLIEELTELVEEAVLNEFSKLSERGGVLGAMETQYQRSKIQEESMHYEHLKHSGELPIIGVNTFMHPDSLREDYLPPPIAMARASFEEKESLRLHCLEYQRQNQTSAEKAISDLKTRTLKGENIFAALMDAARVLTLKQMTQALFEVGGQYRRNV